MKTTMISITKLSAVLLTCVSLNAIADDEAGFKALFNGKDLTGWKGDAKLWSVKDGAIKGQTTAENPAPHNTFLIWTNGTLGDFELRLSYKITANNDRSFGDSGIQYRSKEMPDFVVAGYQANLMVTKPLSGILYEEKGRGIIHQLGQKVVIKADPANSAKHKVEVVGSFGKSEEIQSTFKADDWNDYVVIAQGNHLQHFVNGKQTADVTDEDEARAAKSGILALQLHAGQPMTVEFRKIRMKPLKETASSSDDLKQLQGTWRLAAGEANGETINSDNLAAVTVTVKDDTYEVAGGDNSHRGTFSVDPSKSPKEMNVRPADGNDAGKTIRAIYELDGDTFRACYGEGDGERPTAFKTGPDGGSMLVTYKRKKD
jgi:uncharacterized protein (TIGR03067 family)